MEKVTTISWDITLKKLSKTIDAFYKNNTDTMVIELHPRQVWNLMADMPVTSAQYHTFNCLMNGTFGEIWFEGAILRRKDD